MKKTVTPPEGSVFLNTGEKAKRGSGKWWIKTVLLLVVVGLSIAILFTLGDYLSGDSEQIGFGTLLTVIDYPLFLLFLLVILAYIFVECTKFAYLMKVYTGKFRLKTAIKVMFVGKYYDAVTPFASGGQPFQIYYLYQKKDISRGAAAAIPMARLIASLTVWCLVALCLLAFAPSYLLHSGNVTVTRTIQIIAWVSVLFNLSIPLFFAFISFFPKATTRFTAWCVFLLKKMHIVRKEYAVSLRYVRLVRGYCGSMQSMIKEWKKLLPLLALCLVESAITVSIPFFVVISVANIPPTAELYLQIICLNVISQFAAYLIPTPGNAGAVETTTSFIFITVSGINHIVGWVILVWRFFTFYMYILSGIGISIFELIRSALRRKNARLTPPAE